MRQFGAEPDRTLMIGDTTHDLQLAANAGTPSVAVAYGAHAGVGVRRPFAAAGRRADGGRARRLARRACLTPSRARRARCRCAPSAELEEAGTGPRVRRAAVAPPGARVRAALRGPRRRLHEPLRARAHRDGLAAPASSSTTSAASSSARCTAPSTSPPPASCIAGPVRGRAPDGASTSSSAPGRCIGILRPDIGPVVFDDSGPNLTPSMTQDFEPTQTPPLPDTGPAPAPAPRPRPRGRARDRERQRRPVAPGARARAGHRRADARSPQRAPLAPVRPPRVVPARAGRRVGPGVLAARQGEHAQRPAHGAGGDPRRDRVRGRRQRREHRLGAAQRVRGEERRGRRDAHQLAGRQPGAGRHRLRRDQAPEGPAPRRRSTRSARRCARPARTTWPWAPTRSTSTRPASSAPSAC